MILIEHGVGNNVGDLGMLEGVLAFLALSGRDDVAVVQHPLTEMSQHRRYVPRTYPLQLPFPSGSYRSGRLVVRGLDRVARKVLSRTGSFPKKAIRGNEVRNYGELLDGVTAVWLTGGGYLNSIYPANLEQKQPLIVAAAARHVPVVLTGQQLGPFGSRYDRARALEMVEKASFVGIRDPGVTMRTLEQAIAEGRRIRYEVLGDDALGLLQAPDGDGAAARGDGRFIAANFRESPAVPRSREVLGGFGAILKRLQRALDLPVRFVPIRRSDEETGRRIMLTSRLEGEVLAFGEHRPASLIELLKHAHCSIGVSHHFAMFSLFAGVPMDGIAVSPAYRQKNGALEALWPDLFRSHSLQDLTGGDVGRLIDSVAARGERLVLREHERRVAEALTRWKEGMSRAAAVASGQDAMLHKRPGSGPPEALL